MLDAIMLPKLQSYFNLFVFFVFGIGFQVHYFFHSSFFILHSLGRPRKTQCGTQSMHQGILQ